MIVVNLEKYSDDGYKKAANSLNSATPDVIKYVRFYYDDFTGSNYIQATFVSGENSTAQGDNSGIAFTRFKLFTSEDGVTYSERKSYGGDLGKTIPTPDLALDPADFTDDDLIMKTTVATVEQFVGKPLSEVQGDGLTKLIIAVTGVAGNASLNHVVLYNNTGETITSVIRPNNGTGSGDWAIVLTGLPFNGKAVLFESQIIFTDKNADTDDGIIAGYCFMGQTTGNGSEVIVRMVNPSMVDDGSILAVDHWLKWTFIIFDHQ